MREYTVLHLFSGLGGAALGFQQAVDEFRGQVGKFRTLAGIDCDPDACSDFETLTGAPAVQMDLFTRDDYAAFHGHEPGPDWREVTPVDLLDATSGVYPDVVFLSPPCKGFSGLLPSDRAASEKYQALNRLVVRGLSLMLEAFSEDLPATVMIENVPRITTRGAWLLKQVKHLLGKHGYVFHEGFHDCGELGGLSQHRKRYLLIARNVKKMGQFIYHPPKMKVRAIGETIGLLPFPDDPKAGPLHRLPRLKWKTWVRLALIPAGGDWRDLPADGQYGITYEPRSGAFQVADWDKPSTTVIGSASTRGSNGVAAVADPRLSEHGKSYKGSPGLMGVNDWKEPASTVTGSATVTGGNCPSAIADPRLSDRENRHPAVYRVAPFDEPANCVTGTRFGSGAPAVADPRTAYFKNVYRVVPWKEPAGTTTSGHGPSSGGVCVADPRLTDRPGRYTNKYAVENWQGPANCITGIPDVQAGAPSVADPRLKCSPRSGTMGVQDWNAPASTVIGAGDIHASSAAIADPRIPTDNDRPDPPPVIISLDGTWHRPLTTLELAALQGFPLVMVDGSPLTLAGRSDAKHRERIGNAVPPPTAKAIGMQILAALMASEREEFMLSATGIWVKGGDHHDSPRHIHTARA